jgi:hypothetical protein
VFTKFESIRNQFLKGFDDWERNVRGDFYHASRAFRKSKLRLNLLNLCDAFCAGRTSGEAPALEPDKIRKSCAEWPFLIAGGIKVIYANI